jgi:hypothetical protein
MSAFNMRMVGYHHFKKNLIKFFFIKKVISLMFHETNLGMLNFKSPLLKPKHN